MGKVADFILLLLFGTSITLVSFFPLQLPLGGFNWHFGSFACGLVLRFSVHFCNSCYLQINDSCYV